MASTDSASISSRLHIPDSHPTYRFPRYSHTYPVDRLRKTRQNVLVKQVLETRGAYEQGRLGAAPSEKLLWNRANRYVRMSGSSKGAGRERISQGGE